MYAVSPEPSMVTHTQDWLYSISCVKQPLSKRPQIGFQYQLLLDAGQKYCRMLQGEHFVILLTFIKLPFVIKIFVLSIFVEHSAILSTFIKLPFVIKIFVLSIFEWPFYTGFTVPYLPYIGLGKQCKPRSNCGAI